MVISHDGIVASGVAARLAGRRDDPRTRRQCRRRGDRHQRRDGRRRADVERHRRRSVRDRLRRQDRQALRAERERLGAERRCTRRTAARQGHQAHAAARHRLGDGARRRRRLGRSCSTGSGRRRWPTCSRPAIAIAERGFPGHRMDQPCCWHDSARVAPSRRRQRRRRILPNGQAPKRRRNLPQSRPGRVAPRDRSRWPRRVLQGRRSRRRIVATSQRARRHDDARRTSPDIRAEWVEPISTTYRGWTVYELPPNGQGIAALEMLNIMETLSARARYGPDNLDADALHADDRGEEARLRRSAELHRRSRSFAAMIPGERHARQEYAARRARS